MHPLCRASFVSLPTRQASPGVGPHPTVDLVPTLASPMNVVLVVRATTVPFTPVMAGPERTTTDSATPTATCGDPRAPR
jgi:hypothetical protein